jgi:glycosyltransferase involved in cell wall biosynthesis
MSRDLVVVIPIFNEAATVGGLICRLRRLAPVVVVDDGSTDEGATRALAAGAARVIRRARREGKGAALKAGFAEALRMGAAAVATLDGDGQHDPSDLPRLAAASRRAPRALILGDRLTAAWPAQGPRARLAAVRLADRAVRWITGTRIRDSQCGFRIYPAPLLQAVPLREERFVLETEVLIAAARGGHELRSVPVRPIYFEGRESRFRPWSDGSRIAWYLAREATRELGRRLTGNRLDARSTSSAVGERSA